MARDCDLQAAGRPPDHGGEAWEAEEEEEEEDADLLERQLAADLLELEALDRKLRRLCGAANEAAPAPGLGPAFQQLGLEDLPVERICVFLPALGFAALRGCGGHAGRRVGALLDHLAQRRKVTSCSGPPLLLPLLRFSHCLQAPRFALAPAAAGGAPPGRRHVGCALELLPPGCAESCCPLRLRSRERSAPQRATLSGTPPVGSVCRFALPGHFTPRVLQLQFGLERGPLRDVEAGQELAVSLVDSAVPKQPLFVLVQEHWPGQACSSLRATVRTVESCRGGAAGAWAYKQRAWSLGQVGAQACPPEAPRAAAWQQVHVEFDWEAALCAALVDGRVEGPLEINGDQGQQGAVGRVDSTEFGGAAPTVNEVHIFLAPGMAVAFSELLVG